MIYIHIIGSRNRAPNLIRNNKNAGSNKEK